MRHVPLPSMTIGAHQLNVAYPSSAALSIKLFSKTADGMQNDIVGAAAIQSMAVAVTSV